MTNKSSYTSLLMLDGDFIDTQIIQALMKKNFQDIKCDIFTNPDELLKVLEVCTQTLPDNRNIAIFVSTKIEETCMTETFLEAFERLPEEIVKKCHVFLVSTATEARFDQLIAINKIAKNYKDRFLSKPLVEALLVQTFSTAMRA